jgi:hypothetical protein
MNLKKIHHGSSVSTVILFFLLVLPAIVSAQFPNPVLFNTAANAGGTGTLPYGANDLHWSAAMTSSLGTYTPAVVVGTQFGWSPAFTTQADWITYPHSCSVTPADHSCHSLLLDEYYKLTFNLPPTSCSVSVSTPGSYCLSLDFMADNCVTDIWVNGVMVYTTSVTNPSGHFGFNSSNKVTVSMCSNWQPGVNNVIVHIVSGAYSTGGLSGFMAQVNHTINPTYGGPPTAILQTTNACNAATGSASFTPSSGASPFTYSWSPSGATLPSATGLVPGVHTVVITGTNSCTNTYTFAITQSNSPTLAVSGTTMICPGKTVTLTASGASSYQWTGGPSAPSMTAAPFATTMYTVTGTSSGCSAVKVVTVAVTICEGLAEHTNSSVSIYPNPVKNVLTISSDREYSVQFTDALGRPVLTGTGKSGTNSIDTSQLPVGIYVISVNTGQQVDNFRLVKE